MFLQCENLYHTALNRCDCCTILKQRHMWCWTGTMRFLNVLFACGRAWRGASWKVQPRSEARLLSGGAYVGRGVAGREEQLVPSPATATSLIPDTHIFLLSDSSFYAVAGFVCECVSERMTTLCVCPTGRWGSFPFALDKHFLSVNIGEPGIPQFPD